MPYGPLVESRLRVLSWNLWGRFGPWEARQPAILSTIAALDPDVACLQEAWSAPESSMAALVGERLGFHHVHSCNDDGPVHSGNAIVSRWPILQDLVAPAPRRWRAGRAAHRPVRGDRRPARRDPSLLHAPQLAVRPQRGAPGAGAAHRCLRRRVPARDYPPILSGDMNAAPDSDEIRMLTGRTGCRGSQARVPRRVGGGRRRPWDDVVERQPVRGARPRAGSPHRLRVRGLAQARRPRPCGAARK